MPQDWARTQYNMDISLQDQVCGDHRRNIDEAIECYKRALQVYTRESMPQD